MGVALDWERSYGNAPSITAVVSEYDAAKLIGLSEKDYSCSMVGVTAVRKGFDFLFDGKRYQVKANRPSGKRGSFVTWVPKATNYDWDYLIWILYNPIFEIQEAWLWDVASYKTNFDTIKRLSPAHYRAGKKLV